MKKVSVLIAMSTLLTISACKLTQDGRIMIDPSEATALQDSPKTASWTVVGTNPLSSAATSSIAMSMFNGSTPYVAYADGTGTSFKLAVQACTGGASCTSWTTVGTNISANEAYDIAMAVYNNSGTANPYVVYRELVTAAPSLVFKPVVKMFNGTSWSDVGNISSILGATVPSDWYPQVAVYDNGGVAMPFVVAKGRVMYYNGTSWSFLGLPIPGAANGFPKIAIHFDGTNPVPYVLYRDETAPNPDTLTLAYYDYSIDDWAFLGGRGFGSSTGTVGWFSFYFTAAGTPYTFFEDTGTGQSKVMTYSGSAWVNYVTTPVSSTEIAYPAIAVDETDSTVYVAYRDSSSDKLIAKKSTGTTFTSLGTGSISWVNYINLGIDTTNHVPLFSYEDDNYSPARVYVKKYQ